MKRFLGVGASIALFSFCGLLNAEVIYQTGFEPPAYSTGTLIGQNGWSGPGPGFVENTLAHSGTQAVEFDSSLPSGQYEDGHGLTYNALTDPNQLLTVSVEEYFTGSSDEFWGLATDSTTGFMGQILVHNGVARFGLASTTIGSVAVASDTWNLFSIVYDFSNDTESAYANSTLIGSAAFVKPGSTNLDYVTIGYNEKGGTATDLGYFDDLSVTAAAAPEPSSLVLLCSGLIAGAGIARTRMRAAGLRG